MANRDQKPLVGEDAFEFITVESLGDGAVCRISLNRRGSRNAQSRGLLVKLDGFAAAERDDDVRIITLGGVGPMFSSGHDMGSRQSVSEREPGPQQHPTYAGYGGTRQGAESRMLREWHFYFENTLR